MIADYHIEHSEFFHEKLVIQTHHNDFHDKQTII